MKLRAQLALQHLLSCAIKWYRTGGRVNRKPSITTKELRAVQLKVEFVPALIKDTLIILTAYSLEVNCGNENIPTVKVLSLHPSPEYTNFITFWMKTITNNYDFSLSRAPWLQLCRGIRSNQLYTLLKQYIQFFDFMVFLWVLFSFFSDRNPPPESRKERPVWLLSCNTLKWALGFGQWTFIHF